VVVLAMIDHSTDNRLSVYAGTVTDSADPDARSPSQRVYLALHDAVMDGDVAPGDALRPQEIATGHAVSLAAAREALLRLVGEGLAERVQNRGFRVPAVDAERWRRVAEARALIEPGMLRLAIDRGDLEWEARVRAAHHRLAGTALGVAGDHAAGAAWREAHRAFHRVLVEACGNDVLLATFDRLWTASELARRWSIAAVPDRDALREHETLERAVLDRDADRAAGLLAAHVKRTVDLLAHARGDAERSA
jgi:DNA-binding GntR family transcriptional regulator